MRRREGGTESGNNEVDGQISMSVSTVNSVKSHKTLSAIQITPRLHRTNCCVTS